ncbi:MAG: hypothetical protein QM758_05250 [Armatimonas sp.]
MRRICALAVMLAIGVGLSGCGGGGERDEEENSRLVATWQLVKVSGGFTGDGKTETPNEQLKFNSNGTFVRTVDGVATSGTYAVSERKTIFSEDKASVITYTPNALPDIITTVDTAHLTVNEEAADGYTREYQRAAL